MELGGIGRSWQGWCRAGVPHRLRIQSGRRGQRRRRQPGSRARPGRPSAPLTWDCTPTAAVAAMARRAKTRRLARNIAIEPLKVRLRVGALAANPTVRRATKWFQVRWPGRCCCTSASRMGLPPAACFPCLQPPETTREKQIRRQWRRGGRHQPRPDLQLALPSWRREATGSVDGGALASSAPFVTQFDFKGARATNSKAFGCVYVTLSWRSVPDGLLVLPCCRRRSRVLAVCCPAPFTATSWPPSATVGAARPPCPSLPPPVPAQSPWQRRRCRRPAGRRRHLPAIPLFPHVRPQLAPAPAVRAASPPAAARGGRGAARPAPPPRP